MPAPRRAAASRRGFVPVLGHRLEYARFDPPSRPARDAPALVLLHDELGSLATWLDFPRRLAESTGCVVVAHSRCGHGQSDARSGPLRADHLHAEARSALPEFLLHARVANPVLVGDRDGAAIALIHAAAGFTTRGIVAMSPRVRVEEGTLGDARALRARFDAGLLPDLSRRHRDPSALVHAWSAAWLDPAMRDWSLERLLPAIACPLLLLQGEDDRGGSLDHLAAIARGVRSRVDSMALAGLAGPVWREAPDATCAAIDAFVRSLA